MSMKKLFSEPLFFIAFILLAIAGCALQVWYFSIPADAAGLLPAGHISTYATVGVLVVTAVLAILATPHMQVYNMSATVRCVGAFAAAGFMAVSAVLIFLRGDLFCGALAAIAALGSVYVGLCRLRRGKVHYTAYALFAVCFMFYLITRYRVWSAEPETARYLFQLLALVCAMLVFYQKAALHARTGKSLSYHFWRCMTFVLCMTAIPGSTDPCLYLGAAIWMLLASSPRKRETPTEEQA